MKKLFFTTVLALAGFIIYGQNSAVNKAEAAQKKGNVAEAKDLIDAAMDNPKTKNLVKAYYVKGLIYGSIATSTDESIAGLDSGAVDKTIESYNKIFETEKETSAFYIFAQQKVDEFWAYNLNNGATKYENESWSEAYKYFLICQQIKPNDTTAYYYAAVTAQLNEDWDNALSNFNKLIELGSKGVEIYGSVIRIHRYQQKDTLKALEVVRVAIKEHPANIDLKREEINLLIILDLMDDAQNKLEASLQDDPDNSMTYYSLAYMQDESGDEVKAIENYTKAIELNPEYFEACFNLAVIYYNKGASLFKEANNLSLKAYQQEGEEIEERGRVQFRISLPYWEKAAELDPEDVGTLQNLQGVYTRLKMMDKASDVASKMDALEGAKQDN